MGNFKVVFIRFGICIRYYLNDYRIFYIKSNKYYPRTQVIGIENVVLQLVPVV